MHTALRRFAGVTVGAAAIGVAAIAPATASPSTSPSTNEVTSVRNNWGGAYFDSKGDKIEVCDYNADGAKVYASVQKWYDQTHSWQAVGSKAGPKAESCDYDTIDVEPDGSLIRLHLWSKKHGKVVKQAHSESGHA